MEKYGFVYIWYDKKRKMFYIGSHWGHVDDGYVCSSDRMREAYRRRRNDFKRKILAKTDERKSLLEIEQKWLSKVKNKKQYYNLNFDVLNPWWHDDERNKSVKQKLKENHWTKNPEKCEEVKRKISLSNKGKAPSNKGISWPEEKRVAHAAALKGHKKPERSFEHRKKISDNNKRLQNAKIIGMHNKKHKSETKFLMSKNNGMNSEHNREKVKQAKKNIKWLVHINTNNKKMAIPGTDKWELLLSEGYIPAKIGG